MQPSCNISQPAASHGGRLWLVYRGVCAALPLLSCHVCLVMLVWCVNGAHRQAGSRILDTRIYTPPPVTHVNLDPAWDARPQQPITYVHWCWIVFPFFNIWLFLIFIWNRCTVLISIWNGGFTMIQLERLCLKLMILKQWIYQLNMKTTKMKSAPLQIFMITELTLPSGGVRQGDTLTILQLARHPHPAHTSTSPRWTHAHGGRLSSCAPLQEWCVDATKVRVTTCPGVWWTLERKQDSVHSDRSRDTFFWWNPSPGGHTGDISWQRTSIYRHGHISPDIGWDIHSKKADNVSKILKYHTPSWIFCLWIDN